MTFPTYATQEPRARSWAVARGLLHPDGTPDKATPQGQMAKTMEEIGEVVLEMIKLERTKELCEVLEWLPVLNARAKVLRLRRHRLAMEYGDILVTLTLQAAMQGATLEECRRLAPGGGSPHTWQFVEKWARKVGMAIDLYPEKVLSCLGALCLAVEDETRIQLSLTGPEVLAMALDKIEGRQGAVVGGVFVKA